MIDRHPTGVVFVHGIGSQPPRETFLDWTQPIVRMLAALRREHDETGTGRPVGEDPVLEARIEEDRIWARIEIPAVGDHPSGRWLLTEAYWAAEIRAPDLSTTVHYIRERLPSIVGGIARGYGAREPRRKERLASLIEMASSLQGGTSKALIEELQRAQSRRWAWVDLLDAIWMLPAVRWILSAVAISVALAGLGVYTFVRAIPIRAVSRRAELAMLDSWLVEWFGDLPVLLDDRVQSAMIRSRLGAAIDWLLAQGCEDLVIVAHSGGAIVSYTTLLRSPNLAGKVAKLITLGQGLALGWRLSAVQGDLPIGNPLRGDLGAAHPTLRWVDFWASYDPAPAGPLVGISGSPLLVDPAPGPPAGSPIRVESRPITNLMHMAFDHGGYWDNDEGFLVPLLRHIDDQRGDGQGSRFYGDPLGRAARIERRRRRVGLLLGWRWLSFGAAMATLLGTAVGPGLASTGVLVARAASLIPGHELVRSAIDSAGSIVTAVLDLAGLQDLARAFADLGPLLLGATVPVIAVRLIYNRGVETWQAADGYERAKIRPEELGPEGEPWARSEAALLVGGLAAPVAASWLAGSAVSVGDRGIVVGAILLSAVAMSLVARFSLRRPPTSSITHTASLDETARGQLDD
jgi:hypothetical protein